MVLSKLTIRDITLFYFFLPSSFLYVHITCVCVLLRFSNIPLGFSGEMHFVYL
jgi:hypothetical protein